jgi:mutator protein MutT
VAIAIVFDSAPVPKLLICRRKAGAVLAGYWEFPGGKCHMDEPPAVCVVREVEEEMGLVVAVLRPLAAIEHEYPHARVRLHPFVCRQIAGTLELRAVAEALWIDAGRVAQYTFPEANGGLLKEVSQGLGVLLQGQP